MLLVTEVCFFHNHKIEKESLCLDEWVKMSAKRGWNLISKAYQASFKISLDDVHYGPISSGETELEFCRWVESVCRSLVRVL